MRHVYIARTNKVHLLAEHVTGFYGWFKTGCGRLFDTTDGWIDTDEVTCKRCRKGN